MKQKEGGDRPIYHLWLLLHIKVASIPCPADAHMGGKGQCACGYLRCGIVVGNRLCGVGLHPGQVLFMLKRGHVFLKRPSGWRCKSEHAAQSKSAGYAPKAQARMASRAFKPHE